MRGIAGVEDLGLFRVLGQPNLNISVDRQQAARHGINVSDLQDAVETAVGGKAVSQVLQGEQRYDLVSALSAKLSGAYVKKPISKIFVCLAPSGERVSLAQLATGKMSATAPPKFTAKKIPATSPLNTASAAATSAAPWKKP